MPLLKTSGFSTLAVLHQETGISLPAFLVVSIKMYVVILDGEIFRLSCVAKSTQSFSDLHSAELAGIHSNFAGDSVP